MRGISLSIVIAAYFSCGACLAESYLCVTDVGAGIGFNKTTKTWGAAKLENSDKYVVSRPSEQERKVLPKAVWLVKPLGETLPIAVCDANFSSLGMLRCSGLIEFHANRSNGRFLSAFMLGYVGDTPGGTSALGPEGDNTPAIFAGRCSPIQ